MALLGFLGSPSIAETLDSRERTLRPGDKSVETVVRTDERYSGDRLFQGPRGWGYWNYLSAPRPIQNPNLWPDMQSTYFIGRFALPAGARMVMNQGFPHSRYFQFALYVSKNSTFISTGETITGPDIQPDPGAVNPYVAGNRRDSDKRDFKLTVLAEDPPADRSQRTANTLYAGAVGGTLQGIIPSMFLMPDGAPANALKPDQDFPNHQVNWPTERPWIMLQLSNRSLNLSMVRYPNH